MKTILTSLLLCFCATLFAQDPIESKEEENTAGFVPFAWYKEQEERKEAFLKEYFKNKLEPFKTLPKAIPETELTAVEPRMPIYSVPKPRLSPMPVIPTDTKIKHYLKVYPVEEKATNSN